MRVVLYSRRGCHLCEQAEDMVATLWPAVAVVDVDAHSGDQDRFGLRVPVLEIDDAVVMEGRFEEAVLIRLLTAGDERSKGR
jgi:glutaredoxin